MSQKTHLVDNRWIEGTGELFISTDPGTGESNWEGQSASTPEIDDAFKSADRAFEVWADLPVKERILYATSFRRVVEANKAELAEIISREVGKPLWESNTEVDAVIGKIALSVQAYEERRSSVQADFAGAKAVTRFRPYGAVAVFGPYNLPGHLPNGHIVPALIAGNTVVLKPSEQAPLVSQKMAEYWLEAGLPPGVLNMVQGGRDTGALVARHSLLRGLFFTGSATAGKMLHKAFGGRPEIIMALEMGGNNPLVIWEASDLEAAAYLAIQSAYITGGQRCTCARRLIVRDDVKTGRLVEALEKMIGRIRIGRFTDRPEPFMGPLISKKAVDDLLEVQQRLQSMGGRIIVEMTRMNGKGNFLKPGLMDVTDVADRPDEEFFGPFLQLIRVPDFDAAVKEANRTVYGLAAGLISDNRGLFDVFVRKVRAGVINWNRQITGASGKLPFGGIGLSGNNRPSGFFAADYCSHPVASIEMSSPGAVPADTPGMNP